MSGLLTASTKKVNTPEKTQMTLHTSETSGQHPVTDNTCITRMGETHPVPKMPEKTMGTAVQQIISYYCDSTCCRRKVRTYPMHLQGVSDISNLPRAKT